MVPRVGKGPSGGSTATPAFATEACTFTDQKSKDSRSRMTTKQATKLRLNQSHSR